VYAWGIEFGADGEDVAVIAESAAAALETFRECHESGFEEVKAVWLMNNSPVLTRAAGAE
jgi:hypothetical protein